MSLQKMDFTYVEFPCSVDLNTFKAYFNLANTKLPKIHGKHLHGSSEAAGTEENANQVKSLRHLALDSLVENWADYPVYKEIPRQEDRNYILSNLNVNISLKTLSTHISSDFFWRKCFQHRWKIYQSQTAENKRPWINIYMERHLQEFMEKLEPGEYELELVQSTLDICAAYINQLEINYLQPVMDGSSNDHIPLDYILGNLPELHDLRLTYCTKTVGINFYLGCNMISPQDMIMLSRGLSDCHELQKFCTKLEPYQLHYIARSLDKACHNLTHLCLVHCSLGDEGIKQFLEACNKESFGTLTILDLTNNKITSEGALLLSRTLKHLKLERLILRLNPLESDGTAAIFAMLYNLPLKFLDISGCSIKEDITKLFMQLIMTNRTLLGIDICNNDLGEEFGVHIYKILGFNKTLQYLDLRNTGLTLEMRDKFKAVLHENYVKSKKKFKNLIEANIIKSENKFPFFF